MNKFFILKIWKCRDEDNVEDLNDMLEEGYKVTSAKEICNDENVIMVMYNLELEQ